MVGCQDVEIPCLFITEGIPARVGRLISTKVSLMCIKNKCYFM